MENHSIKWTSRYSIESQGVFIENKNLVKKFLKDVWETLVAKWKICRQ
jgi:hypothetical protein